MRNRDAAVRYTMLKSKQDLAGTNRATQNKGQETKVVGVYNRSGISAQAVQRCTGPCIIYSRAEGKQPATIS